MNIESLLNKLIENDRNGHIINELIEQDIINVNDLIDYVCGTNDYRLIYYVSRYVKNINISKLEDKVLGMSNTTLIIGYAKDIQSITVLKFEDKFIELGNARDISVFALAMSNRGINISRLEDKLIEIGSCSAICDFARGVKGANIFRLEDFIIKNGEASHIYEFASMIKKSNLDRLTEAMIKTNDIYWISMYAKVTGKISVDKMIGVIINNSANIDYHKLLFAIDAYDKKYTDVIIMKIINHFEVDFVYNVLSRFCFHLSNETIDYLFELVLSKSLEIEDMTFIEMLTEFFVDDKKKMKKIKDTLQKFYNRGSIEKKIKVKKRTFYKK